MNKTFAKAVFDLDFLYGKGKSFASVNSIPLFLID